MTSTVDIAGSFGSLGSAISVANGSSGPRGAPRPGPTIPTALSPLVDARGFVSREWYRFFVNLLNRTGGSNVSVSSVVYLALVNGVVQAYNSVDNSFIGDVEVEPPIRPALEVLTPAASPWVFSATSSGQILVNSAVLEFSRDGLVWYTVCDSGGAVQMLPGDFVRVSWASGPTPTVVFAPDNA